MAKGYSVEKRTSRDGTTSYRVRVRYKAITAPYKTFQTKGAADRYGRETVSSIDLGTFKRNTDFSDYAKITLGDAIKIYIDVLPTRTAKEISRKKDYENKLAVIRRYAISKLTLAEIESSDVNAFIQRRRKDGLKENTIRNDINVISRIFTYGNSELKLNRANPVSILDRISKPKKGPPRDRRLEEGEYEAILKEANEPSKWAKDNNDKLIPTLFRFAANSGLRLGETSRIEADEKMISKRLVYLHGTKNENDRHVPLTQEAYDALMEYKDNWGEEMVFDYTEKQLTDRWSDFKKKLLKKGIIKKDLTMHDLRHESLSRLFEINNSIGEGALSLADIINISGHKDVKTLINTYVKVDPLKTVEKLQAVGA